MGQWRLRRTNILEILSSRPGWNLFRDGCPDGETPAQISARADRLINRLSELDGNVALFSHSHLGRVLAGRWIGISVEHAEPFLLNTASISILSLKHDRRDEPVIELWNSIPFQRFTAASAGAEESAAVPSDESAIQRWDNEGGHLCTPLQDAGEKELIVFDLDGTLTQSKSPLDAEMAELLASLLCIVKVAVISGAAWPQFEKQMLAKMPRHARLQHLSILPTCGTRFYQFADEWTSIYSDDFDMNQKAQITSALRKHSIRRIHASQKPGANRSKTEAAKSRFLGWVSRLRSKKKKSGTPTSLSERK